MFLSLKMYLLQFDCLLNLYDVTNYILLFDKSYEFRPRDPYGHQKILWPRCFFEYKTLEIRINGNKIGTYLMRCCFFVIISCFSSCLFDHLWIDKCGLLIKDLLPSKMYNFCHFVRFTNYDG